MWAHPNQQCVFTDAASPSFDLANFTPCENVGAVVGEKNDDDGFVFGGPNYGYVTCQLEGSDFVGENIQNMRKSNFNFKLYIEIVRKISF